MKCIGVREILNETLTDVVFSVKVKYKILGQWHKNLSYLRDKPKKGSVNQTEDQLFL